MGGECDGVAPRVAGETKIAKKGPLRISAMA